MPTESERIAALETEVRHSEDKKHWLDYVTFVLEFIGLVVLCVYAVYTIGIYYANNTAAEAAKVAAEAANKSASWTRDQAINIFKDQRPRVWIKISDSIHI